jgi:trans-aconitate 2-methyltransferase
MACDDGKLYLGPSRYMLSLLLVERAAKGVTMPTWDPQQYLKFEEYRSRPCKELVAKLSAGTVFRAIDLGCGPGNSTEILAARFPAAQVIAVDNSESMLAKARATYPDKPWHWESGDIATWSLPSGWLGQVDVILANASFQWIKHHDRLFPRLMSWLRPGGQLAVQMPVSYDLPVLALIEQLGHDRMWKGHFDALAIPYTRHKTQDYYGYLSSAATMMDLVEVSYFHHLASPDDIVEWSRGTGLRPWLDHAGSHADAFLAEYRRRIHAAYPRQEDGSVLMKFRRVMILATR